MSVIATSPSPVSGCARSILSRKGRGEARRSTNRKAALLPLWEKVPEGRMRGIHSGATP